MVNSSSFCGDGDGHQRCIDDAIAISAELCAEQELRLTETRRRILELIWRGHEPVGAYAILAALNESGCRAAPPTVNRALDFLESHGFVHKIQSLSAYIGCSDPRLRHSGQFLICGEFGSTHEMSDPEIVRAIRNGARQEGFEPRQQTIEIRGLCPDCIKSTQPREEEMQHG